MKPETKVGILFVSAFLLIVVFSYFLGILNPFSNSHELSVAYNYAGGIEVGSPVRVMGIKVGKVKSITFEPDMKMPNGEETKLKIVINIDKGAWKTIRRDSKFFINLAGVIGEKFLEISPGTTTFEEFTPGELIRGEDPPRIDQLISQSYGLAGKIFDMVEKNEGSVTETLDTLNKLTLNLNNVLKQLDKTTNTGDMGKLVKNLVVITTDVAYFTQHLRSSEGEKTLALMKDLIFRLEKLDGPAIKKFLQEEGIKAKLF